MILYANAILITFAWLAICCYLSLYTNRIGLLKNKPVFQSPGLPRVTIIVPARNESATMEPALKRLTNLAYPNFDILVVNDRSTDTTGEIIHRQQKQCSRIRSLEISSLPGGWLGKSHALYQGSKTTSADWLLFTDADVLLERNSLSRAIGFCLQTSADHLTVFPRLQSRSPILNSVYALFMLVFYLKYKPWRAPMEGCDNYVGMGAFNLVRRDAYEAIGTHASFPMHPNDDLKLGEMLKKAGFKQQVLYGTGQVGYEWYSSLAAFMEGLSKNAFSSMGYSYTKVLATGLLALAFFVFPVPVFLLAGQAPLFVLAGYIIMGQSILFLSSRGFTPRWWHALVIPFSGVILVYILARSAVLCYVNNGVYWSREFYSWKDLSSDHHT